MNTLDLQVRLERCEAAIETLRDQLEIFGRELDGFRTDLASKSEGEGGRP